MGISLRQFFVILLVVAGLWLVRYLRHKLVANRSQASSLPRPPQETVRCAYCRIYIPRDQAVGDKKQGYCCADAHCLAQRASRTIPHSID
jgi:hypothetical protein